MKNASMHGISHATGARYDVSQHAREGGRASGLSRRLHPLRQLEEKVISSSNGAAAYALLRDKRKDQARLLEEQRRLVEHTSMLLDQRDDVLREIAQEQARRDRLRAEVDALEQKKAALHHEFRSDDVVVELLRSIGEERATAAAIALGWAEDDDDGTTAMWPRRPGPPAPRGAEIGPPSPNATPLRWQLKPGIWLPTLTTDR
jgi:hypothetical protein